MNRADANPFAGGAGDDFLPTDFAATGPVPISPSFVPDTLARVSADRARIATDAELVDRDPLPASLLAHYTVPEPSPDFVARTLSRLSHSARATLSDAELSELLGRHTPPRISTDFVERTLAALRERESAPSLRLVGASTSPAPQPSLALRTALAIAAVLVLGIGAILYLDSGRPTRPTDEADVATTFAFSPSAPTTTFARYSTAPAASESDDALDLRPLDGLLILAAGLGERSE